MHPLFKLEGNAINSFLKVNQIRAKVDWKRSVEVRTGYFRFALKLDERERFSRIESAIRELSSALARFREGQGYPANVFAIPTINPFPAIETAHPAPTILSPEDGTVLTGVAHTAALGRSYLSSPREEKLDFNETPHVLVAGITNAGKSKLLQCILLSLLARTSPRDLKVYLIDLKNEDLLPFRDLPHVVRYAGMLDEALEILQEVDAEKDARIADPERKPYRIVVVLDEMAHLAGNKEASKILEKLATIGRSKWINLIGATQHPTREGGMGSLLKANFGVRYVGQVAPGQSQYATNRPGTHAELLPGKGSFLLCKGPEVYRFQSYFIDEEHLSRYKAIIFQKWLSRYQRPITEPPVQPEKVKTSGDPLFPVSPVRPLNQEEAAELRRLYREGVLDHRGKPSLTAACNLVYGGKNEKILQYVKEALD